MKVDFQNMLPSVGSPSALLVLPPFSTMNESLLTSGYVGRLVGAVAHPMFAPPALLVSSGPVLSPHFVLRAIPALFPLKTLSGQLLGQLVAVVWRQLQSRA